MGCHDEGGGAERIRREANYRKMKSFRTQLRHSIETSIQREWESMNRIYRNAVVEFENTDDAYQRKIAECYKDYATLLDYGYDNAVSASDFARGARHQIVGIFDGLYSILLAANPIVTYLCYTGNLSASMEQRVRGMHEGSIRLALDPLSVLGAMGQSITDTFDEEGLSYAAGYITADIAISITLDKGISKAFGKVDDIAEVGLKAANKVDDAAEIGAKAAGKVDDIAEAGVKAAGKVDDVAEIGAKAAGKVDDVAGSSTKLGNSFAEMMSPEDAAKYQKFLEKGSTSGLKPEELQGITKADAYQALNKVDYNEVLKLRKAGNKGGIDVIESVSKSNPFDLHITHSRTLGKNMMNALMNDIKANAIQETIKCVEYNGQMYVVDGHHRLLVAKTLNLTEVSIEKVNLPYTGYNTIKDLFWVE